MTTNIRRRKMMIDLNLIDTRQGTDSETWQSAMNGNALPYTGTPFGMNHFVPQTRLHFVRYFHPSDHTVYGIRLTHQPSPWMGDFAFTLMTPARLTAHEIEEIQRLENGADNALYWTQSSYRPNDATFAPHSVTYKRLRDEIILELIATDRGAKLLWTHDQDFSRQPKDGQMVIMLAISKNGSLEIDPQKNQVKIYTDQITDSKNHQFGQYQLFSFKKPISKLHQVNITDGGHELTVYWLKIDEEIQNFNTQEVNISTSYISFDQAALNAKNDPFFNMDTAKARQYSAEKWEKYLSKIMVKHRDLERLRTFYTCLWRTATFPQVVHEFDESGNEIYRSPYSGEVRDGKFYTNNGYWDTFRTNYPLYSLIVPEMIPNFIEGILNVAEEDGFLPKWLSPDERGLMPGNLVDAVLADAVVKELVTSELAEKALKAMIYSATTESDHPMAGRTAQKAYDTYGYVPSDIPESVNQTLDYAYSDFCIAQVAKKLDHEEIAEEYRQKALNYQHLYHPKHHQMVGKNKTGEFKKDFNPHWWGGDYTEGSAWQTSLNVLHNVADLIELHGGDESFVNHLNGLINQRPTYIVGDYDQDTHEISELSALEFGQLAISNQPSFHIPYLYIYAGYPNLSQMLIKQLLISSFDSGTRGFPGDEDNGSMSAWYVLSSLGLYQVTPGTDQYVLGISLWDEAVLELGENRQVSIISDANEDHLLTVQLRLVDGQIKTQQYLTYQELTQGVEIRQSLGTMPSVTKIAEVDRPYSMNDHE